MHNERYSPINPTSIINIPKEMKFLKNLPWQYPASHNENLQDLLDSHPDDTHVIMFATYSPRHSRIRLSSPDERDAFSKKTYCWEPQKTLSQNVKNYISSMPPCNAMSKRLSNMTTHKRLLKAISRQERATKVNLAKRQHMVDRV